MKGKANFLHLSRMELARSLPRPVAYPASLCRVRGCASGPRTADRPLMHDKRENLTGHPDCCCSVNASRSRPRPDLLRSVGLAFPKLDAGAKILDGKLDAVVEL